MADKEALKHQLFDMISVLENEGLVDDRFKMVYSYKEFNGPLFFVELISTFIVETQVSLREMFATMEQHGPNYSVLEGLCMKVKGGSSSIGVHRMAKVCVQLLNAIEDRSKDECISCVESLKEEFQAVHAKMDALLQVEKQITKKEYP